MIQEAPVALAFGSRHHSWETMSISTSLSLVPFLFSCVFMFLPEGLVDILVVVLTGASLFKSIIVVVKEKIYFKALTVKSEILQYEL